MIRLKIGLIVLGGILIWQGYQEYTVSQGTTTKPLLVELANIENNQTIENNHLLISNHIAAYAYSIYEYKADKHEQGEPKPSAKVNYTYYPILSDEHPYVQQATELVDQYGSSDQVPDGIWPEFKQFTVLVKTKRFKTISAIPNEWSREISLRGLVVNQIKSLDNEEKALISASFPQADINNIILLEEGRKPSSSMQSFSMMGGGSFLGLLGIGWLAFKKRKK